MQSSYKQLQHQVLSTGRSEKCLDPAGQFGIVVAGQDPGLEQRSQMATIALV